MEMCDVVSRRERLRDPSPRSMRAMLAPCCIHLFAGIVFVAASLAGQSWPETIQIVAAKSATDSSDWKQVVVNCPPGTIAYHGGASVPATSDLPVVIEQSLPVGGDPPT